MSDARVLRGGQVGYLHSYFIGIQNIDFDILVIRLYVEPRIELKKLLFLTVFVRVPITVSFNQLCVLYWCILLYSFANRNCNYLLSLHFCVVLLQDDLRHPHDILAASRAPDGEQERSSQDEEKCDHDNGNQKLRREVGVAFVRCAARLAFFQAAVLAEGLATDNAVAERIVYSVVVVSGCS